MGGFEGEVSESSDGIDAGDLVGGEEVSMGDVREAPAEVEGGRPRSSCEGREGDEPMDGLMQHCRQHSNRLSRPRLRDLSAPTLNTATRK